MGLLPRHARLAIGEASNINDFVLGRHFTQIHPMRVSPGQRAPP